jgi:hypothetical protein
MRDSILKKAVVLVFVLCSTKALAQESACPSIAKPSFSAAFELKNQPLELQIGEKVAEISTQGSKEGSCEAVCTVVKRGPSWGGTPAAVDLDCRSSGLVTFTTPASIVWLNGTPVLRFGTWLHGYDNVAIVHPM